MTTARLVPSASRLAFLLLCAGALPLPNRRPTGLVFVADAFVTECPACPHPLRPSFATTRTTTAAVAAKTTPRPFVSRTLKTSIEASAATDTVAAEGSPEERKKVVPITLLSGFLGSGKTTALKHLLENADGVKIGVVVNDVAAVNIDSKLIQGDADAVVGAEGGVVQLQNGCACCSLADELLTSVESILDGRENELDAVVVELSGVADPVAIKANWNAAKSAAGRDDAADAADSIALRTSINRVVTVVDACTFGTDWMTWDSAGHRKGWVDPFGGGAQAYRKVPELLAEQVECADLILVNKADLAGKEQVEVASTLVRGLNDDAELREVEFGRVSPKVVLGDGAVKAAKVEDNEAEEEKGHSHDHDHDDCAEEDCTHASHSHDHDHDCAEPDCTDASHSHSHEHAEAHDCTDPDCADTSHSHSHAHDEQASCTDPDCTDTSHSHSHSHDDDASCTDPDCTDTSHSHSHSHGTSTDNLGITNFVYKATKPFNKDKLLALLSQWPVPMKDTLDLGLLKDARSEEYENNRGENDREAATTNPFVGVLRSKGFCWFAPSNWKGLLGPAADPRADPWRHDAAMYWSHAGKHFGINGAGQFWGALPRDLMKEAFAENINEYERIVKEDFVTEEFQDRRQEIVFIGAGMDEGGIGEALDGCLLNDEEMEVYRSELEEYLERVEKAKKEEELAKDAAGAVSN